MGLQAQRGASDGDLRIPLAANSNALGFQPTPVHGAWVVEGRRRGDERGFFARMFCAARLRVARAGKPLRTGQHLAQRARRDTLRGMHYQLPPAAEVKLVRCTAGAVFDVIADLRPDSPSFGKWFGTELTRGQPPHALRPAWLRARLPDAGRRHRGALPGQRRLCAGAGARPALRRPRARHRLAGGAGGGLRQGPRPGPTSTRPSTARCSGCGTWPEGRGDDHRRHGSGAARGGGPPGAGRHDRRRLHGARHRQPDRQLGARACGSSPSRTARRASAEACYARRGRRHHAPRGQPRRALEACHRATASPPSPRTRFLLCEAEGLDCLLDVTGAMEYGAQVTMAAIEHGKHLVTMNAELDGTVGPILSSRPTAPASSSRAATATSRACR